MVHHHQGFDDMMPEGLKFYRIILGSKSPRRQQLLKKLNIPFEVREKDVDESYPGSLKGGDIALFLSEKKAETFRKELSKSELLITADTIVWHNGREMPKPSDRAAAINMLSELSGNRHEVFTGICLMTLDKKESFCDNTVVQFSALRQEEIEWYVDHGNPFDKSGGYGVQDWIGHIGIERIEGSFFNVMGLPVEKLYCRLRDFA